MILLIDNYDSFSYNLYQQAAAIEPDMRVVRNDALTVSEIENLNPSHIILSPGPGYPKDAGICEEVVTKLGGRIPILGVCLGHQAICEAFGGRIEHAQQLMHGKQSEVTVDPAEPLFTGTLDNTNPDVTITACNSAGFVLPFTGGVGFTPYIMFAALMLCMGVYFCKKTNLIKEKTK